MFNLQGSEIVIILLLALVVLGPEKLPEAMRRAGQMMAELKKMSAGFQSEFRAAVDEPMRELRNTANTLRDSADFTKLVEGARDEKPKSAEMAPADPTAVPTDDIPTFEPGVVVDEPPAGPTPTQDSKPAPFSGQSSTAPRPPRETAPETASGDEAAADVADHAGSGVVAPERDVPSDEPGAASTPDVDEQPPA